MKGKGYGIGVRGWGYARSRIGFWGLRVLVQMLEAIGEEGRTGVPARAGRQRMRYCSKVRNGLPVINM